MKCLTDSNRLRGTLLLDVGDEDDPRLLTDVIKYLYRHGSMYDKVKSSN